MGFWEKFLGFDPNRKRSFPGEQPGEQVLYLGVFHWITLVPFLWKFAVVIGALLLFNAVGLFDGLSPLAHFFINSTVVVLLIHALSFRLYNYFLKVMLITDYRLIDIRHSVFLRREREVIPLSNIQDIRYQQNGILPRIFNFGDLIVLGSSSDVKYMFHCVPKVNRIHHLLGEVHQRALRDTPRRIVNRQDATKPAVPESVPKR